LRSCRGTTIIQPLRPPVLILIVAHLSSRSSRYTQQRRHGATRHAWRTQSA
jgi:hypothetical protein